MPSSPTQSIARGSAALLDPRRDGLSLQYQACATLATRLGEWTSRSPEWVDPEARQFGHGISRPSRTFDA